MAAAATTLSESTPAAIAPGAIGMHTASSASASQRDDSPSPSVPSSSAARSPGSAAPIGVADWSGVSASSRNPACRSNGQPAAPVRQPGVRDREHRAHRHLHRPPVQRVGAARRQDHRVHAERGRAPEDPAQVAVVHDVLADHHPAGGGQHLRGRRQRPPQHRGQRAAVHLVAGQRGGRVRRDDVHRARAGGDQIGQRGLPVLRDQQRPDRVPGGHGPPDHLLTLGDEQPVLGLQAAPQPDVGQPGEVGQPRVGRVGDGQHGRHPPSLAALCAGAHGPAEHGDQPGQPGGSGA